MFVVTTDCRWAARDASGLTDPKVNSGRDAAAADCSFLEVDGGGNEDGEADETADWLNQADDWLE